MGENVGRGTNDRLDCLLYMSYFIGHFSVSSLFYSYTEVCRSFALLYDRVRFIHRVLD